MKNKLLIISLLLSLNILADEIMDTSHETSEEYDTRKANHQYYKLNTPFLAHLDGIANRLDGEAIDEIMQVRRMIQDLRTKGIIDEKTKKCLNHSIQEFVKLETSQEIGDLSECLKSAKDQFIESTIKFMRRIEGTKKIVIKIMEESCRVRKIKEKDTIMFEWANTRGNEKAIFNEKIKTFKEFDKFLDHVNGFLGDLIKSCPKGFKQYQISKKQKRLKKQQR